MSQGPLCPNLTQKVQKEVSQIANRNLSSVILLGGLSVNLNHLKSTIKATESKNRQAFLMVLMTVLSVTFAPRSPITRIIQSALVWVRFNVLQMFRHGKKQIIQNTPMVFFNLKYHM